MKIIFIIGSVLLIITTHASVVHKKLVIKGGSISPTNEASFPYLTYNEDDSFTISNPVIQINLNDSLNLWVINKDTTSHNFEIKGIVSSLPIIQPGDSLNIVKQFTEAGNYIYFDPLNFPKFSYCGLGGMISVINHNHPAYFWNIKTHRDNWNTSILNGTQEDWSTYNPNFYTINGFSFPEVNNDTLARITGKVGDSIMLYIANTGQSIHSLHFHGYHAEIVYSSKNPDHIGRIKDTFPIYYMETLLLRIVPDKIGEYPIHDHNLVAVTGNGLYPNGMLTTILISP